jgi:hypothetical protein
MKKSKSLGLAMRLRMIGQAPASAYAVLLLLTVLMFGDVLFSGGAWVLSNRGAEVFGQFLAWRQYGFRELAQGHLALWNPYVFSGAPYFGGFQSALLYPPNWIFLVLPTGIAINWSIALHVFLMGAFMNAWARRRHLHPAASCLTGALAMFGGTYFLHIYAGHLTNLCAMVWAPLVFLAMDEILAPSVPTGAHFRNRMSAVLTGSMAVNMQILAGHPQYVFYTAVAAAMYGMLRLVNTPGRGVALAWLSALPVGGGLLAAVQWMAGLDAASETVRSQALDFALASTFSLAPENLVTLVAPGLWGSLAPAGYFGRGYLWEMSLYMGVTGSALAVLGAVTKTASIPASQRRQMALMVLFLLVLALGAHTPLFRMLYDHVPGFDKFRGMAKFVFPASLFVAMLAGIGFDVLIRSQRASPRFVFGVLTASGIFLMLSVVVLLVNWLPILQFTAATGDSYRLADLYRDPSSALRFGAMAELAQSTAAKSLALAGVVALLLGALALWTHHYRRAVWVVGMLALAEVFTFAVASRDSFRNEDSFAAAAKGFLDAHPGDYRIANTINPNGSMAFAAQDVAGNDPGVVRRYAELMTFLQGGDPDKANQYLDFLRPSALYAMLRLRYVFHTLDSGEIALNELPAPMPHAILVGRYRRMADRDAIFASLLDANFDVRKEVILETSPNPSPSADPEGTARVVTQTGDTLTVEVETRHPAILLITDLYTPSWRAVALPGSVQGKYDFLPANYVLRAVPLIAGQHKILIEYRPRRLLLGAWLSIFGLIAWVGIAGWHAARKSRRITSAVPIVE